MEGFWNNPTSIHHNWGGGLPEDGALSPLGDALLRQELAGLPRDGQGASLIPTAQSTATVKSEIKDYPAHRGAVVHLSDGLLSGVFVWQEGDHSYEVSNDPGEGVFLSSNSDPEALTGAWERYGFREDGVTPEMFSAVGDGVTDDTIAFENMVMAINAFKIRRLILNPGAEYRIGRQEFTGADDGRAYGSVPMMSFIGFERFELVGNGATVKLNDGMRYGSFDPVSGESYTPSSMPFTNWGYAAVIGWTLRIEDSKNVKISNLTIDGNMDNLVVGGAWGDTGIQLRAVGVALINVTAVELDKVRSINNGLDGLYIHGSSSDTLYPDRLDGIHVKDCVFDLNGRQGCSITGGSGITFDNCVFSNTGTGVVSSAPKAGIDLEPNRGNFCSNIRISGCLFENNDNTGLISDSGAPRSRNLVVEDCEFWSFTNDAIWLLIDDVLIRNCKIHGSITSISNSARVENCLIDNATHPIHGESVGRAFLLQNGGGKWTDCSFRTYNDLKLLNLSTPTEFNNCTFTYGGGVNMRGDRDWVAAFPMATLTNCSFYDDLPEENTHDYWWSTANSTRIKSGTRFFGTSTRWGNWNPLDGFTGRRGNPAVTIPDTLRSARLYTVRGTDYLEISTGLSAPSGGEHRRGNQVINRNPSPGAYAGWVCVQSGSPGVWKGYGLIEE